MCSYTTSSDGGYGSGGHGNSSSSFKKTKRQRIPKRGPGVAELEKILREQQNQEDDADHHKVKIGGSSLTFSSPLVSYTLPNTTNSPQSCLRNVSLLPEHTHQFSLPLPPPLPTLFPNRVVNCDGNKGKCSSDQLGGSSIVLHEKHFSRSVDTCDQTGIVLPENHFSLPLPPMASLSDNVVDVNGNRNGGKGGGQGVLGVSGVLMPDKALVPKTWPEANEPSIHGDVGPKLASGFPFPTHFSNGSDHNQMLTLPSPPVWQRKQSRVQPSTMNLFPETAPLSSSTPTAAGSYHHLEPPSSQRSCNFKSSWQEEDKMAGTKRPRPFPVSNLPAAPVFHCQLPSSPPHVQRPEPSLPPHVLRQEASSSCNDHGKLNHGTTSRDKMPPNSPSEGKTRKTVTDYGILSGTATIFGSPITPPPIPTCQQEFSKIKPFPLQEMKESSEGSHQRSGPDGLIHKKTFYSFLVPEEKMGASETAFSLKSKSCETSGDDLDLNLKL